MADIFDVLTGVAAGGAAIYSAKLDQKTAVANARLKSAEAQLESEQRQSQFLTGLTSQESQLKFLAVALVGVAAVWWIMRKGAKK